MKKFNLKYELLRKIRKQKEKLSVIKLAKNKDNLKKEIEMNKSLFRDIDRANERLEDLYVNAKNTGLMISEDEFIRGTSRRIMMSNERIKNFSMKLKESNEVYLKDKLNHSIIEKLQEKQRKEYKKTLYKERQKIMDELMIIYSLKKEIA